MKEALKKFLSEAITDNDELLVKILEYVEDNIVEAVEPAINEYEKKYNELLAQYKSRFLGGSESTTEVTESSEVNENDTGLEEVEIVEEEDILEEVEK